jgi:hypothetical protein
MSKTYTSGDLCRLFREEGHELEGYQVLQAIRRGFLDEPPRVGIYRVWSEEDLPRVRAALVAAGYLREEVTHAP